jgi:hypothetical protein
MSWIGAAFVLLASTLAILVVSSVHVLARRAGLEPARATRITRLTAAIAILWLGTTLLLANAGFYRAFESIPPRIPLTAAFATGTVIVLLRTPTMRRLVDAMPSWWPIAIQFFRVPVELLLWALYKQGAIPEQMTFEGRNFDVLVGATAPLVAYAVYREKLGPLGVAVWNLASLGLLVNIVVTAITSMPGPLHIAWGGVMPVIVAEPPFPWLPAFLVPLAAVGHVVSLRKVAVASRHARES